MKYILLLIISLTIGCGRPPTYCVYAGKPIKNVCCKHMDEDEYGNINLNDCDNYVRSIRNAQGVRVYGDDQ